jgi:EAL domain-containing protein (putative c-di-GMP-specific phosphodiesterase class I)
MRRILLLDDEPSVLSVLSDYLRAPGLEIVTCREIEAAEILLNESRFNVVITDLRVSELGGLEGMRLIRYATTHFPGTVVVAMSGYVNDSVRSLGKAVGASEILEKPLDLRRLKTIVHGENDEHIDLLAPEGQDGTVIELDLLDNFLSNPILSAVLQPIVDLEKTTAPFIPHAVESLARAHKSTPLANPELLFAYASKKERLYEADCLCIRAAFAEAAALTDICKLFINVTPRALTTPGFADTLTEMAKQAQVSQDRVVFELTEQQTILNPQAFAETLQALRKQGFGIALDDYGVGFANLQLVQDLRPDYIKMSGYFCRDIHLDDFKQEIVRSTAQMAQRLGIPTVLENIETEDELAVVQDLGITYGQGYYFSRPATQTALIESKRFIGFEAD